MMDTLRIYAISCLSARRECFISGGSVSVKPAAFERLWIMDKETIFSQADSGSEEGQMGGGFYQALEARYRGSRECIKERFRIYLPFLTPWLELDRSAEVADLGCGRGEWLELLQEHGFKARGVDVDGDMLDCCAKNGFSVEKAEAVTFLKSLSDDSQAVVSAFHVVEHITFEHLQMLVSEAFRVLKPGGLLILETPNPENILVSTKNFYRYYYPLCRSITDSQG
jgi:SAM-dependent methyltransferase